MTDILDRMPYARFLGLQTLISGDEITVTMPFQDRLIGNQCCPPCTAARRRRCWK